MQFPLLSDWKRKTVKDYGVYNEATGYGTRATFVIDKDGIIRHRRRQDRCGSTGAYQACSIFQEKKS